MSTSYKDGKLTVDLADIFLGLVDADKDEFIDRIACEDGVIKCVADQIITGWTEMDSHGATGPVSANPCTALDVAIREVAKRSGETAKAEIERLESALKAHAEIVRQRDEMLAALREVVRMTGCPENSLLGLVIFTAIAKAEGK